MGWDRSGAFPAHAEVPPVPFCSQLHEKFEHLKRIHQEEKRKVEEKRRELEEESSAFSRRKLEVLQSQALQATSQQPLRKDKDKKK